MVSETVDFVQLIGAGIKDLGGSDDLEVELFFFPSFDLVLFGTRCASFLPMAQLEELQQETNLDQFLDDIKWVSILDVDRFGCGKVKYNRFKVRREELTAGLKIPLDFWLHALRVRAKFSGSVSAGG